MNGNYDDDGDGEKEVGPASKVFPGEEWAATGPKYLMGYNWFAPADNHGGDPRFTQKIVREFFILEKTHDIPYSWGYANKKMAASSSDSPYNVCVIDVKKREYWYWKRGEFWGQKPAWVKYRF